MLWVIYYQVLIRSFLNNPKNDVGSLISRNKLFPESVIRNITFQILQGLSFIHKHGRLLYQNSDIFCLTKLNGSMGVRLHLHFLLTIMIFVLIALTQNDRMCESLSNQVLSNNTNIQSPVELLQSLYSYKMHLKHLKCSFLLSSYNLRVNGNGVLFMLFFSFLSCVHQMLDHQRK